MRLLKSCWCVECCYAARWKQAVGGLSGIDEWSMPFCKICRPSLPPFKHAEHRLVFVLRNIDGRRMVASGWKELSRFAQNEWKWRIIKHIAGGQSNDFRRTE